MSYDIRREQQKRVEEKRGVKDIKEKA